MATKFILDAPYLKNSKIALALSGGRDSMALAYALKAQGTPFFAINFEHGIRGDKSIKDSQFVRAWCEKNGVECLSITLDTPTYAKEKGLTIEQGARELRYFHFDKLLQAGADAKTASNFLMGEVAAYLKEEKISIDESKLTVENFAKLLDLLKKGTISNNIAKGLIVDILNTGEDAQSLVDKKGLSVISDESSILPIVQKIVADNPEQVAAYKGGRDKLFGFFVGQAMKETKGRANPQLLNKLLKEELDK